MRRGWERKPGPAFALDRRLISDAVVALGLDEGCGSIFADRSGRVHNGTLNGSGDPWRRNEHGAVFDCGNQTRYIDVADHADLSLSGSFTILMRVMVRSQNSVGATFAGSDTGGGNQPKWIFWIPGVDAGAGAAQGHLAFNITSPPSSRIDAYSPSTFSPIAGRWYDLGVRKVGNVYTFWINGRDGTFTDGTSLAVPAISMPLTVGYAEPTVALDGQIEYFYLFTRGLSDAEIARIFDRPSEGIVNRIGDLMLIPPTATRSDAETVTLGEAFSGQTINAKLLPEATAFAETFLRQLQRRFDESLGTTETLTIKKTIRAERRLPVGIDIGMPDDAYDIVWTEPVPLTADRPDTAYDIEWTEIYVPIAGADYTIEWTEEAALDSYEVTWTEEPDMADLFSDPIQRMYGKVTVS